MLYYNRENMIFIKLKSGRDVYVEEFKYNRTYEGRLGGIPNATVNIKIVNRQEWHDAWNHTWATYVIQPSEEEMMNYLPFAVYKVKLASYKPVNKIWDNSSLVVIWFDELPGERPLKEIIKKAVFSIDWDKYAEDGIV